MDKSTWMLRTDVNYQLKKKSWTDISRETVVKYLCVVTNAVHQIVIVDDME